MRTKATRNERHGEDASTARARVEEPQSVDMLVAALGARMDADVSGVRIHSDAESARTADALDAHAFTVGQHIHFAAGELDASSRAGQKLIAHELVHTVQDRGAGTTVAAKSRVAPPDDAAEEEADRLADALVDGAGHVHVREAPAAAVHRKVKPGVGKPASDFAGEQVVHRGVSGMDVIHTPWGKYLYPYPYPTEDKTIGSIGQQMDQHTAMLIATMETAEKKVADVKRRAPGAMEEGSLLHGKALNEGDRTSAAQLECRLDDDLVEKAQNVTNVGTSQEVIKYLLDGARHSLTNGVIRLRSAIRRKDIVADKRRSRAIQAEIDSLESTLGVLQDVADACLDVAFDPEAVGSAVTKLVYDKAFEYGAGVATSGLEEEKERLEEDALDKEERSDADDEEVARNEIGYAKEGISKLHKMLAGDASRVDQRRKAVERAYDRRAPKDSVKLGDLRKRAEHDEKDAGAADDAKGGLRHAMEWWSAARHDLGDVTHRFSVFHQSFPEISDAWLTLANMANRNAQQQNEVEGIAFDFRNQAAQLRKTLVDLDERIVEAAERTAAEGRRGSR